MNLFSKLTFAAVVSAASVLSAAEVFDMTAQDFWAPNKYIKFADGQVSNSVRTMYRSKKAYPIDPTKKYTIAMDMAVGKGKKNTVILFGLAPALPNGKMYHAQHIQTINGTFTEVAADAKRGDTQLKLKDASKWVTTSSKGIALNAKEDYSDIPNLRVYPMDVKSKVKDGDVWTLTLAKPLHLNLAAGTKVRQHAYGGYFYFGSRSLASDKTSSCKNTVTGQAAQGMYDRGFPPKMTHAYVIILSDWTVSGAPVTFKNAKFTIE